MAGFELAQSENEQSSESESKDSAPFANLARVVGGGISTADNVPPAIREPVERATATDLSTALIHQGPEVDDVLAELDTPAAAVGRHILVKGNLASNQDRRIVRHELVHTAQAHVADPDLGQPLVAGRSESLAEHEAKHLASSPDGPSTGHVPVTPTSANVVHGYLGLSSHEKELVKQREEARRKHQQWVGASRDQFHSELSKQAGSLGGDISRTQQALMMQRVALIRRVAQMQSTLSSSNPALTNLLPNLAIHVPADLADKWAVAQQAVILVETASDAGPDAEDVQALTDAARKAFVDFYLTTRPFLSAVEKAQRERQSREKAERERQQEASRQRASMSYLGVGDVTNLQPTYAAPPASSPELGPRLARAHLATSAAHWGGVVSDFTASTAALDQAMLYLSPKSISRELAYARELLDRQEEHRRGHPDAIKIPAVFHPRDALIDVGPEGGGGQAAQSIPWLFYLHRTDDEWVLVDLTSPKQKTNRTGLTLMDRVLIERGEEPEPPKELFAELNSSLRFPKGHLYWESPNGQRWSMETTEPWTVSSFLTAVGIGLAVVGLVLLTGGTATPGVVAAFGLSAAAGIGSTLAGMSERAEQGMLTDKDIGLGMLAIGADLLSGISLGMTKIASISVQAGRLARLSALAGRHLVTVKAADAILSGAQFMAVTAEFVSQYEAIKNAGLPSDKEDEAIARLALTGLLTGGIMAFSAASSIRDLSSGTARVTVDADGNVRILDDALTQRPRTGDSAPGRTVDADPAPQPVRSGDVTTTEPRSPAAEVGTGNRSRPATTEIAGQSHTIQYRDGAIHLCTSCGELSQKIGRVLDVIPEGHSGSQGLRALRREADQAQRQFDAGELTQAKLDEKVEELSQQLEQITGSHDDLGRLFTLSLDELTDNAGVLRTALAEDRHVRGSVETLTGAVDGPPATTTYSIPEGGLSVEARIAQGHTPPGWTKGKEHLAYFKDGYYRYRPGARPERTQAPRLQRGQEFDPGFRRPVLGDFSDVAPAKVDRHSGTRTDSDARVSVWQERLPDRVVDRDRLEEALKAAATPEERRRLGHLFEQRVGEDHQARGLRQRHQSGDRTRIGDVGRYEVTLEGQHGRFGDSKLDQIWRDMIDHDHVHITVPKLDPRAQRQLAQLAAIFEEVTGRKASIAVREVLPD